MLCNAVVDIFPAVHAFPANSAGAGIFCICSVGATAVVLARAGGAVIATTFRRSRARWVVAEGGTASTCGEAGKLRPLCFPWPQTVC